VRKVQRNLCYFEINGQFSFCEFKLKDNKGGDDASKYNSVGDKVFWYESNRLVTVIRTNDCGELERFDL